MARLSQTTADVPGIETSGSSFAGGALMARFRRLTAFSWTHC